MSDHGHSATAGAHGDGAHGDHADHGMHGGIAKYIYVFVALCVLTGGSFCTTSEFWRANVADHISWAFMMAVSCTKAMLVILFFMHVKYEANWKYVLTIPAAFMSIFLILALVPDVGFRGRMASEERKQYMAEDAPPVGPKHGYPLGEGPPKSH